MTTEHERPYWFHRVLGDKNLPFWRHGRVWLTLYGKGTKDGYPTRAGQARDLELHSEWLLFRPKGHAHGFGWAFKWGTNGSETTPDFSVHLSRLGDLYVTTAHLLPYRWFERYLPDGRTDYDSRVFGFTVDGRGVRWDLWSREGHWSSSDPWWVSPSWQWRTLFFGNPRTDDETVGEGLCVIPMPEANYPATWTTTKYTHLHPKFLGRVRDRVLGARTHTSTSIEPGKPVPVPGKGENSWDCGDDAIYGISAPGNVESAIGALVADALRTRRRHGGEHMSVPGGPGA